MKWLSVLLLMLISVPLFHALDTIEAESKVSEVIVYPEWAYVTRSGNVTLKKGQSVLVIRNIDPWIDSESIHFKVQDTSGIKIAGVTTRTVFLKQSIESEITDLEKKILTLEDQITDMKQEKEILRKQQDYIQNLNPWKIDKITGEAAARKVELSEIREFEKYVRDTLSDLVRRQTDIDRKVREIAPELTALKKSLKEIAGRSNLEKKEILIELEAQAPVKTDFMVRYLISGASWYPQYDARIEADGRKLTLSSYAIVQQTTGESWENAKVILSTVKPFMIKEKPELNPWFVNPGDIPNNYQSSSINRSDNKGNYEMQELKKKQELFFNQNESNQQALKDYNENILKQKEVIEQAEERGTTVEFSINGFYTIKTDGKPVRLPIADQTLDVASLYSAIPVVSKSTYVSGTMRNTSTLPYLPGVVQVYKGGNFIGKSKINFTAENEKFEIYMGLEERIKVSRTLDAQKSSPSITGNRKKLKAGYRIEVQNFLNNPITINIQDQLPVSQNNQIKIKTVTIDPAPVSSEQGILKWDLNLAPMEKRTIQFEFEIDYPSQVILDNAKELERQIDNLY